jgi:hypothetical protein
VVQDAEAITEAITAAVAELSAPESEDVQADVADAVAQIIATATNVEEVTDAVQIQIEEAVAADPELEVINARLTEVEEKVGLLGK